MKISIPQQRALLALHAAMYDSPQIIHYDQKMRVEIVTFWLPHPVLPWDDSIDGAIHYVGESDVHIASRTYDTLVKRGWCCKERGILTIAGEEHVRALMAARTLEGL